MHEGFPAFSVAYSAQLQGPDDNFTIASLQRDRLNNAVKRNHNYR